MLTIAAKKALVMSALLLSGCAGATFVPFANADSSCTRTTWWIEAPQSLIVGEETTLHIRRCQGRATPKAFSWSTSNRDIVGIVSADSNQVVIKGLSLGKATIAAVSKRPPDRSTVAIFVIAGRMVKAAEDTGEF